MSSSVNKIKNEEEKQSLQSASFKFIALTDKCLLKAGDNAMNTFLYCETSAHFV